MLYQIITNFYFSRLLYIILFIILTVSIMNNLKERDNIEIKKYLNIKNINIKLILKYLFLSFIIRILLEQLVLYIPFKLTNVQTSSNIFEIMTDFLISCVFAPIFEEIIFRFGLYKKLNNKLNIFISMIITSIIFSMMHFYNVDGFIILFGISLIWNYSFYKTNSLFYPIFLHFIHNLYAMSNNFFNYDNYCWLLLAINVIGYFITVEKKQKK